MVERPMAIISTCKQKQPAFQHLANFCHLIFSKFSDLFFMADQSTPYFPCNGQVAGVNLLWWRNYGQHIFKWIEMEIIPQRPENFIFTHSVHAFHLAVGLIHLLDNPWVYAAIVQQGTPFPHNLWRVPLLFVWSAVCWVICGIKAEVVGFLANFANTLQIPSCRTHAADIAVEHFPG